MNTMHLFIDRETEKIVAYVSLCNDSIGLDLEERDSVNLSSAEEFCINLIEMQVVGINKQHTKGHLP